MGATISTTEIQSRMVRLVDDQLVLEDRQRDLYVVPPKGEYEWELTGYALPFELKRSEKYRKEGQSETQTMTRIEFTILGPKGAGKKFDQMFGFSIGARSNLGKLLRAAGVPVPANGGDFDLDHAIGYRAKSYVTHAVSEDGSVKLDENGKPKFASVSIDTIEPLGKPSKQYTIDVTAEMANDAAAPSSNGNGHHTTGDDGWPDD